MKVEWPHPGRVESVALQFEGWANQMWARFGGAPVYLVGSYLTEKSHPRDIDISIVMHDNSFERRYRWDTTQHDFRQHGLSVLWHPNTSPWLKMYWHEMAGLHRSLQYNGIFDIKVMPKCFADKFHSDKPKLRLDAMEGYEVEADH